jgi:hypothetical protein
MAVGRSLDLQPLNPLGFHISQIWRHRIHHGYHSNVTPWSPARESLRPASKKKKLNQLDEGEEFEVTVTLDESVHGVGSVSVQMKRDETSG